MNSQMGRLAFTPIPGFMAGRCPQTRKAGMGIHTGIPIPAFVATRLSAWHLARSACRTHFSPAVLLCLSGLALGHLEHHEEADDEEDGDAHDAQA